MVDIFDSGLFVGAVINTLEQTFPFVYVITETESYTARNTFVISDAKNKLNLRKIISQYRDGSIKPLYLKDADISKLKQRPIQPILTDNYNPVENLLAPVVRDSARAVAAENIIEQAEELKHKNEFSKSISLFPRTGRIIQYHGRYERCD